MNSTFNSFVFLTVEVAFVYFVFGKIFLKAGYSRWESLLLLIPLLNLLVLLWFAFADWPIERELLELKCPGKKQTETPPLSIHGLPQRRL